MRKKLYVHLYVTTKCNLACKHCYSAYIEKNAKELSLEQIVYFIRRLEQRYNAFFDVEGGEIFLRQDINRLLSMLTESERQKITITTNGTILAKVDPLYLKQLDEFRVSVEGHTTELQENIRGVSLLPIMKNCEEWLKQNIPVEIRMTIHRKNYQYIQEACQYYMQLGVRRFSFYEFQPVGRGEKFAEEYNLDAESFEIVLQQLCSLVQFRPPVDWIKFSITSQRGNLLEKNQNRLESSKFEIEDISVIPTLTINSSGKLGICPWNISDQTIEITSLEEFEDKVDEIVKLQRGRHTCNHCSSFRLLYK